jgi:hypothetical protein
MYPDGCDGCPPALVQLNQQGAQAAMAAAAAAAGARRVAVQMEQVPLAMRLGGQAALAGGKPGAAAPASPSGAAGELSWLCVSSLSQHPERYRWHSLDAAGSIQRGACP